MLGDTQREPPLTTTGADVKVNDLERVHISNSPTIHTPQEEEANRVDVAPICKDDITIERIESDNKLMGGATEHDAKPENHPSATERHPTIAVGAETGKKMDSEYTKDTMRVTCDEFEGRAHAMASPVRGIIPSML